MDRAEQLVSANKYAGNCTACGAHVARGAGVYDGGIYCGDREFLQNPATREWESFCPQTIEAGRARMASDEVQTAVAEREDKIEAMLNSMRAEILTLATEARVRSLDAVLEKHGGFGATLETLNSTQVKEVYWDLRKRIERRTKKVEEQTTPKHCRRCGGAGRADAWRHTGSVCYECGGDGKYRPRLRAN